MHCAADPTYDRMKSTGRSSWKSQSLHFKSNIDNSTQTLHLIPCYVQSKKKKKERKKGISNKF